MKFWLIILAATAGALWFVADTPRQFLSLISLIAGLVSLPVFIIWYFASVHHYRCPRCQKRGLKAVGSLTGGPSYHLCYSCGARLKRHMNGPWLDANEREWAMFARVDNDEIVG
jgi:hypothetical protein